MPWSVIAGDKGLCGSSANWRIVFEFAGENATNVDLVDCHQDSKGERQ